MAAALDELVGTIVFELTLSDLAGSYLAPFESVLLRVDLEVSPVPTRTVCLVRILDKTWVRGG